MFTNEKLRLFLFVFLAFAVLSSKHVLIYNEETLVSLSFFCFLFFVLNYFGNTIKDSLNERSGFLREELGNFLILKQNAFQELLNQHQKITSLLKTLEILNRFTKTEVALLNANGEKAIKNMFTSGIQTKLKTHVFSKSMTQQKLQFCVSDKILSSVLVAFSKKGKGAENLRIYQNKATKNAINSLVVHFTKK